MNDALTPKGSDQPNRGPDSERLLSAVTTPELVKAVARAICRARLHAGNISYGNTEQRGLEDAIDRQWPEYEGDAYAAIETIRSLSSMPKSVPSLSPTQDRRASPQESLPASNNHSETP